MIQLQRHERMLQYLAEHEFLTLSQGVQVFQASVATVRRDFNDLARQNLVRRTRGGVKLEKNYDQGMTPFRLREIQYSAEKEILARRAVAMLKSGEVIFIDGGTTTSHLAMCLPNLPLRIITNSLRLASLLEEKRMEKSVWEIYLTGGYLYPHSGILLGPNAASSLMQYHADWAFLSAGGVTENGISNTNDLVVETERVMIENAERVVILADHSKIGKRAMCHVCNLDKIDILITDPWPENETLLHTIEEKGVELIKCS